MQCFLRVLLSYNSTTELSSEDSDYYLRIEDCMKKLSTVDSINGDLVKFDYGVLGVYNSAGSLVHA